MKTVTIETKAWITQYSYLTPKDLFEGRINGLSYNNFDMTPEGWTYVGTASISVEIADEKTLIDNKVEALREEAKSIRAEATKRVMQIEDKIQQLLALPFYAPVGATTEE